MERDIGVAWAGGLGCFDVEVNDDWLLTAADDDGFTWLVGLALIS
jgi:hypothetical protein